MMEARVTEDRDDESPAEVGGTVVAETAPGAKPEDTSAFTEVASKKEVTLNELLVIAKAYAQPEQIRSAVEEALAGANKLSDKDDREIDIDAFRLALTYIVDGVKPKNPNYLTGGFPEDAVAVLQYY